MEEESVKKYLNNMNKIIRSDNPKYMSFVSREYMKYAKTSPVIAEAIGNMIFKRVNQNSKSPYSIFLHDNGSVCLDSMSDISKISNVSEFITHVEELSKVGIDFKDISADDLIIEGDEIAEEIAKELDKKDLTEEDIENIENKANKSIAKIGILATIGGAIGAKATGIFAKLKDKISGLKNKKVQAQSQEQTEKESTQQTSKKVVNNFDEVCPRVVVNEELAIEKMQAKKLENKDKTKNTDTYGDGDPDGDDLDL